MKSILARAVATLLVTLATFALIGLTAISRPAQAQGFCALHVPPVCTKLAGEVADLKAERNDLQAQLKTAAPGEKGGLAAQIKKLNGQIAPKEKQLATCEKDNGKADSPATFKGTATLTTNDSNFPGPFVRQVTIGLVYQRWVHDEVIVSSFPTLIVGPYDVPIGTNTTTVKLISSNCGAVNPATGRIEIILGLKFEQSHILAGNSTLSITLSTEVPGGSRLTKSGAITLVGDGTFVGGAMDKDQTHIVVAGTLLPLP